MTLIFFSYRGGFRRLMLKFGQNPNCPFLTADSLADTYFSRKTNFFSAPKWEIYFFLETIFSFFLDNFFFRKKTFLKKNFSLPKNFFLKKSFFRKNKLSKKNEKSFFQKKINFPFRCRKKNFFS